MLESAPCTQQVVATDMQHSEARPGLSEKASGFGICELLILVNKVLSII